jgi:chemotaxis signal transduction protein
MNEGRSPHAEALRRRFDESFAEPAASPRPVRQRLLLIQVGTDACAVAMADCAAVERTGALTRLPRAHPAFEGLTSVAGTVLPVYDLARLLALPAPVPAEVRAGTAGGLMLISARPHRVAFLVAAVDGYAEVDADAITADAVVLPDGRPRRLIRLAAVIDRITREAPTSPRSER